MRTLNTYLIGRVTNIDGRDHTILSMGYTRDGEPVVTVAPVDGDPTIRRNLGGGWTEPACVRRLRGWWHCAPFEFDHD